MKDSYDVQRTVELPECRILCDPWIRRLCSCEEWIIFHVGLAMLDQVVKGLRHLDSGAHKAAPQEIHLEVQTTMSIT